MDCQPDLSQGFGGADKFETRLLIPSKMGGAVIGKKGCNIQQLRSDYNATIRWGANLCVTVKVTDTESCCRVPDAPGPERIMSVTCEDLEVTDFFDRNTILRSASLK